MQTSIDELLTSNYVDTALSGFKNVYHRQTAEDELSEKIRYKLDALDWKIYIDGNTFRTLVRGIAICSTGLSFCDDKGQITHIPIGDITGASISNTSESILINGRCITLGKISKSLVDFLLLIRSRIQDSNSNTKRIRVAKVGETLWYIGYHGKVSGPFNKNQVQTAIYNGEYEIEVLQVWSRKMTDWTLISCIGDFEIPPKVPRPQPRSVETIDINQCSLEEILLIPGISREKASSFIEERKKGRTLKNIFEFQAEFDLKPHEIEALSDTIVFRLNKAHGARRLDM